MTYWNHLKTARGGLNPYPGPNQNTYIMNRKKEPKILRSEYELHLESLESMDNGDAMEKLIRDTCHRIIQKASLEDLESLFTIEVHTEAKDPEAFPGRGMFSMDYTSRTFHRIRVKASIKIPPPPGTRDQKTHQSSTVDKHLKMGRTFKKVPNNRKKSYHSGPGTGKRATSTWYGSKEQIEEFKRALAEYIKTDGYKKDPGTGSIDNPNPNKHEK